MASPSSHSAIDLEKLAHYLEQQPDYRVLRRLPPLEPGQPTSSPAKVLVVDTETTGLDARRDKLVDIGIVAMEVDAESGRFVRILGSYEGLEDPGGPLPAGITALTGITDEMVRGQRLDDAAIREISAGADLVVAHSAAHDRPFLEARLPLFERLPWACSLAEIDWKGNGYSSSKLEFLAFKLGFFFDAHRALTDSQALARVLCTASLLATGQTALQAAIAASLACEYRILAIGAAFETKDALKARGYRWDGEDRVWHTTVGSDQAYGDELDWLKHHVYAHRPAKVKVETRDAYLKYSNRRAEPEWRSVGAQGDGSNVLGRI